MSSVGSSLASGFSSVCSIILEKLRSFFNTSVNRGGMVCSSMGAVDESSRVSKAGEEEFA